MSVPMKWQAKAVRRAAERMDVCADYHERQKDDQARAARAEANALLEAALTLQALAHEQSIRGETANG